MAANARISLPGFPSARVGDRPGPRAL